MSSRVARSRETKGREMRISSQSFKSVYSCLGGSHAIFSARSFSTIKLFDKSATSLNGRQERKYTLDRGQPTRSSPGRKHLFFFSTENRHCDGSTPL